MRMIIIADLSSLLYRIELLCLNKPRFLQGEECTSFFHCLQAFRRHIDGDLLAQLGDEKRLFLEIYLAATLAGRIEFGRTRSIGIAPADLGF